LTHVTPKNNIDSLLLRLDMWRKFEAGRSSGARFETGLAQLTTVTFDTMNPNSK